MDLKICLLITEPQHHHHHEEPHHQHHEELHYQQNSAPINSYVPPVAPAASNNFETQVTQVVERIQAREYFQHWHIM